MDMTYGNAGFAKKKFLEENGVIVLGTFNICSECILTNRDEALQN